MHPKIDPKSIDFLRLLGCFLTPFWSHVPLKVDESFDAQIYAEKVKKTPQEIIQQSMTEWTSLL